VRFISGILLSVVYAALLCACSNHSNPAPDNAEPAPLAGNVVVQPQPFRLQVEADGKVLLQQSAPVEFSRADGSVDTLESLVSQRSADGTTYYEVATASGQRVTVSVAATNNASFRIAVLDAEAQAIAIAFNLEPGELIYGLTERLRDSAPLPIPGMNPPLIEDFNPDAVSTLDRRGEIVDMFVRPTISLYAPFYHSSRGYGLWVEGTHPGVFDIGASTDDQLRFRMETTAEQGLAFNVFLGPQHQQILQHYFERVGYPIRVPDWAFRHWLWHDELPGGATGTLDGNTVNAVIAEDMRRYEQYSIPAGVYLFDRPYLVGADDPDSEGFHRFEWDEQRLPNIDATLDSLRARGFKLAVWSAAWARNNGPGSHGAEAQALGYLAPGNSRVIDLTNPAAYLWWQQKLESFLTEYNINGIKLDRGEEFVPSALTDIYSDGRSGREVHNAHPVMQARVHHDALKAATQDDFVVLARAGYSGSQQWAASWGGDDVGTELSLRSCIIKLQRAGFIGFPTWGSDTGGYYAFSDREVFARWLQFSALTPIMEIGGIGSRSPWNMPTEPNVDTQMIEIYARYVNLHHALIPYTAAQADLASTQGIPIARAMMFDFPEDARFADSWDQYMYGPDLLVAPVWQSGVRQREVLIPAGTWRLYWDQSQSWTGPTTISIAADLETLPLFIRDGATVIK
jgi:alpha-glucosidase (family GH31 glycosyl hydrolase)